MNNAIQGQNTILDISAHCQDQVRINLNRLQNQISLENNQYPQTIDVANTIFINHYVDNCDYDEASNDENGE